VGICDDIVGARYRVDPLGEKKKPVSGNKPGRRDMDPGGVAGERRRDEGRVSFSWKEEVVELEVKTKFCSVSESES